jgi:carbon storage regulator
MLVISRNVGEKVVLWRHGIIVATVSVLQVHGDKVKIGVESPPDVTILREELGDPDGQDYG